VRSIIAHGLRVLEKLESLPFPASAAIDGAALGGGLEVALACDYRVVGTSDKVKLGLPEVTLGLIPGWGGTQRLPRIVGPNHAAEMLTSGDPADARYAAQIGLADTSVAVDSVEAAAALVGRAAGVPAVRAAKRNPVPLGQHGTAPMPGLSAPAAAREAFRVMAAGIALPLAVGIKLETAAFMNLAGSPESKRLIEAFFASRKK
jgi:enoyl-CoA hydratase/carnithine racemase